MAGSELPDSNEMEEPGATTFTRRIALTTAIFAVLLGITFLGGHNAAQEMMLAQQQSSDKRALYQATAMRENLYKINGLHMEADILTRGPAMKPNIRKLYAAMLKDSKAEEVRDREEKKKVEEEAKYLEAERDRNRAKNHYFDYAGVLLLISLLMASISILAASRQIFYFAIGSASLGTLFMLNGFFLILNPTFFR
jgi:hypothetical protein